jgi:choline dehydrogenase-like flavoprotein
MMRRAYDAIVIGSGFGGTMVAHELVRAGAHVLMLERGDWVERGPHNWEPSGARELSPHFTPETPYDVIDGRGQRTVTGSFHGVGGPSVFYGGVAMRLRVEDFAPGNEIVGDSGAEWPFGYDELAPWYDAAERLLGVAGSDEGDPTAPPRRAPYPSAPAALSRPGRRIDAAARGLGLHPFRLPLAINYVDGNGRRACQHCTTCDGFACAIGAKNDLATGVLPALVDAGLELRANTVAVRLVVERGRVNAVECVDRRSGERSRVSAARVVLAAGALATPHLLLASGLDAHSPAPRSVGRHLMRHRNALVFGVFPARANPGREFHKQVAIHDFYLGAPDSPVAPPGKLGGIQQITAPGADFVRNVLPRPIGHVLGLGIPHALGMLTIAEDQPARENGVSLDPSRHDRFGLPQLLVRHVYTPRDVAAGNALVREAGRVLRAAGAVFYASYGIRTFSHALGTVRMGRDEHTAPVDADGAYRGVENLYVSDGSILPTSAGVNPSLTIAACALRIGAALAGRDAPRATHAHARHLPLAVVRSPDAR